MAPETHVVELAGATLQRGFWLYVWEVSCPNGSKLLYVGRTGDNSTPNAQSPFNRMGQHLGTIKNSSMLRNHLLERNVEPEACGFRLIAHGPILAEAPGKDMATHKVRRDIVGALEKQLRDDLEAAGYGVMNEITCKWPLDEKLYADIKLAFATELPELNSVCAPSAGSKSVRC